MDLANSPSSLCQKCHSNTMKFDLKSQLFKCFNNCCGYIDSLTVITYTDETVQDKEENTKSNVQQLNNRRYTFAQDHLNLNIVDYKEQSVDKWDRIRNEINVCKKLIRKWCDFIGDRKIEFEIIQNFIDIVNIDKRCTFNSVKVKAASSFCFIIMKYVGTDHNLQQIAETTSIPLEKIMKEQQKIQQIKMSIEKNDNILNNILQNDDEKSYEWDKICQEFLQKMILFYQNQAEKQNQITQKKHIKQSNTHKDINLNEYLLPEEFQVLCIIEQNIKKAYPTKISFERNKIAGSIVLVFCLLTTVKELSIKSPIELSTALNYQEKTILKYYSKYIYSKKEDIIPKQDVWQRRKNLNSLTLFQ